jgi:uncharacterized membrane protein YhiD involved in acid resistance
MEDKWGLFQKFLITENAQITLSNFLINSVIIIVLSLLLEFTYRRCARSLSNRRLFAANFILISFTTMLIINIVKSSLALSLGLVGALSIVRFRSAIKEPEELAYLFFTISVGLGLGAEQRLVVISSFLIIVAFIWVRYLFFEKRSEDRNLYFTVFSNNPNQIQLTEIMEIVKQNFAAADLKRFDENKDCIEASFLVEVRKNENLQTCKEQLQKLSESVRITFIDNKSY